jgi:hypothetical protein
MRGIVRRWVGTRPPTMVTANDLLAPSGDRAANARGSGVDLADILVPAEMLADLHHPFLVITPDYVGPPRRVPSVYDRRQGVGGPERRSDRRRDGGRRRAGRREATSVRPVLAAVGLTAVTVAPLTLVVAQWVAH